MARSSNDSMAMTIASTPPAFATRHWLDCGEGEGKARRVKGPEVEMAKVWGGGGGGVRQSGRAAAPDRRLPPRGQDS